MKLSKENEEWIYDFIENKLHFYSSSRKDSHFLPFAIERPFSVYDISEMTEEQNKLLHKLAPEAIQKCLKPGYMIYAVDWNHNTVLYDPLNVETAQSSYPAHPYFTESGLAYFNAFYPDGDYFFFIDRFGAFGYLSHPWREEVWIFGIDLVNEFEKTYEQLGWEQKAIIK